MSLRPHQHAAIAELDAAASQGHERMLLVAPTGFGKTVVMAELARRHLARDPSYRVLLVVHRRELAKQAVERLQAAGLDRVHLLQADTDPGDASARIVVASLQTLLARGERPAATLVLWDEAHHVVAASFRELAAAYEGALHVGVTATPIRADGQNLGDMFSSLVATTSVRALTAAGWLVPCEVVGPARPSEKLVEDPVDAYLEHALGRPAVVFCQSVAHASLVAEQLAARGIHAASVDGELATDERDARLEAFARGALDVLTNCMVLTEGWDCPRAEVCVLASGSSHAGALLQKAGRVLRTAPGKTSALVLDLRGAVLELGLPDEDRRWSLTGPPCRRSEKMKSLARCTACYAIFRPVTRCPRCGVEVAHEGKIPRVLSRAEKLDRLDHLPPWQRDERYLNSLLTVAFRRLGKRGPAAHAWAAGAFRKRWKREPHRAPQEAT